jgi:hypothetical protein
MIRTDAFRKRALALDGTVEQAHWGDPCWRVRGRIFAVVHPREQTAVLKLAREDHAALVAAAPDVFKTNAWSHQGWTIVDLRRIAARDLWPLVEDAWREVAEPKPRRAPPARARRSATTDG